MEYLIMAAANLLIGGMIGLTGIAGFLLPMLYSGFMGMPSAQGLALSFCAFLISGILGSYNYYRSRSLDLKLALFISLGSFAGAIAGVNLNLLIEEGIVKKILYLVVLLSGISILIRKENKEEKEDGKKRQMPSAFWVGFGFVTGLICSLSGAGGPVLVMPLLVVFGVPVKTAVGIALFDSIFIAIPSCIGYASQSDPDVLMVLLPVTLISHAAGVWIGSRNTSFLRPDILKKGVAVFSVVIAVVKLITG